MYQGSFVSTKIVRRTSTSDEITIRNRGFARLIDEYCRVTGGSRCVTRMRIRFG